MLRSLPEDIFDLWGLLVSAFDSDLPLLRAQANLFEHTSPQKLAGGLQLTDRQFVMEKAWSGLRSSNRPTRVAAG